MGTETIIARLHAGASMTPLAALGSKYAPRLTTEEVKVALGMVAQSFDHALLLAKHAQGLDGYHRTVGTDARFESLESGARRLAWQIRKRNKLTITKVESNIVTTLALDAFFNRVRKEEWLAEKLGINRKTWRLNFAGHFADILAELENREINALRQVRETLG